MKRFVSVLMLAVCLMGCVSASADSKELEFADHNFNVVIDDDVLVMNSETNKNAPVWLEAGISDPDEQLEIMKQMNVLSMLFDKKSEALVNIICKMTEETVKFFSFKDKSEEELLTYVDGLMKGIDEPGEDGVDPGVTYERSLVKHDMLPFFRIAINIDNEETKAREVIYGCVVNGRLIEIDQYLEGEGSIDETFIKKVVDGVRITKFMTQEEYEELVRTGKIKVWILLGGIIFLFVGLFVFVHINKKKKEKKAVRISENLREFRERKTRGEVNCTDVIAMGRATYSIKSIEKYIIFNTWIRNAPIEIILMAFLALIVVVCLSSDSVLYGLLIAVCGIVSVYFNYSGGEKNKANMIARYDAINKPVAKFTFYEEFFSVTGAGALAEYTYDQVMSVRVFNEYLYIFFGTEQGVFVERETLGEEDLAKLVAHIKSHKAK